MLAIQMGSGHGTQEELRTISVGSSIGHGKDSSTSVPETEILVIELSSIDGLASSAIEVSEVSSLAHEVRNNTMESRSYI